ncbi:hypothetical protein FRC18_005849 [Serendipita sp. 400]|nr:hypothetical protein FRC18_005849 [Serendipita sp. 400]
MRTGVLRRLTRNEGGTRTSVPRALQRNNLGIRFQSGMSLPDKFQGKRTTLDVKMPELDEPELSVQIAPENVPFVPDLYHSEKTSAQIAANKAGPILEGEVQTPKVVTAAAGSSLEQVSSNVFQSTDVLRAFAGEAKKDAAKPLDVTQVLQGWTKGLNMPGLASTSGSSSSDPKRTELDEADIRGLYVLLGIVGGGWLLGGLFSKKGHPAKHKHSH